MVWKDGYIAEEEGKKLKEIYSEVMNKNPEDGVIQTEFHSITKWIDDYDEQLYLLSKKMTNKEKHMLIENCKIISQCDGHVHEKESAFLKHIYSVIDYS